MNNLPSMNTTDVLLKPVSNDIGFFISFLGGVDVYGIVLRTANLLLSLFSFLNIPEFFLYRAIYARQKR